MQLIGMQLVGMLDSPYVRRVAISLRVMGIPFEHKAVSVFSTFEQFRAINPVVKAPTLVCDNGDVLMDSTLILQYAELLAPPGITLLPSALPARQRALRLLGLALAACEKAVQLVYEKNLRPVEKQHAPWMERVIGQLLSAYALLEEEMRGEVWDTPEFMRSQAGITIAVVWQFTQSMLSDVVIATACPTLAALSEKAEGLPAFLAFPPEGPGVPAK